MKKILIVDDVEANRKLLRKMLKKLRCCITIEAENGQEAVSQFKDESPDLILMDVNMPIMNGYESAYEIKLLSSDIHVPIIFITALSSEASLAKSLQSGGDDFISKPFNVEVLESKINAHLRIRELTINISEKNAQLNDYNSRLQYEQQLIEHFFESALKQNFKNDDVIKYHMSSMSTFNGDLFLVEKGPNGSLFFVMGDFTGHGLTAAMGTLPVAMIFFKMVNEGATINDIIWEFNHELHKLMPSNIFFAATIIELNTNSDKISVWMGSMPEFYLLDNDGKIKEIIHPTNLPLGVLEDKDFNSDTIDFPVAQGDKIYLCSDGITEAQNSAGEMFGNIRLEEILKSNKHERLDVILSDLLKFTETKHQTDDITLVEITCDKINDN
ncbi:Serine phosphatase RsbU, regulator of sigma subunit [hydrothermal vent metagenome]|uniref:Serine phosphatase RsbU, regulator of sigma subunit n=1 Tax=hydrothermal vent metagenome TaxID=652676 RepID=A0A3B0ZKY6_9ZZZZ